MIDDTDLNLLNVSIMAEAAGAELSKAIEYLREQQPVYVFNRDGETVCITVNHNYAAMKAANGFSLDDALKAEPIT
jgi:hypothetical protein